METAHKNHMSFGKYEAYLELLSVDSDVTLDDCKDMTMGEIKKLLGQCQGQNSEDNNGNCNSGNGNNSNNNGNGNKHHNGKHN